MNNAGQAAFGAIFRQIPDGVDVPVLVKIRGCHR